MDQGQRDRVRKYGEVFTPRHIVNKMCDMLEKESPDCWEIGKTFLEPTCGDGVFVLEILRRKFEHCKRRSDYTAALASVWAMDIQERNVDATIVNVIEFCRKYIQPSKAELEIIRGHVIQCDSLKVMRMIADMDEGKIEVNITPTRRGRWEPLTMSSDNGIEVLYVHAQCGCERYRKSNFCPNCGAKMDL